MSEALPSFHAFTGCDITSAFLRLGKVSAMSAWNNNPEVTEGFVRLSAGQVDNKPTEFLEKFVVCLYDRYVKLN